MRFPNYSDKWSICRLSDISNHLEYGIGASAINYDGIHRYIRITDISNWGSNEITSPSFIDDSALLNENDILLARTGATVGDSFIYKDDGIQSYFAGFLIRVRINKANPYFVYYQLKTSKYAQWVKISSARSGQPGINSEQYGSFKLGITSSEEQQKIADFLVKIDERINTQNKIIEYYESLIKSLRDTILYQNKWEWIKLKILVDHKSIELQRGNIIPKHNYDTDHIYPVYSSSVHNDGLMGFNDSYMFDDELITWSIDGGGNFFLRNKHKFNVTNVCGILKIIDNSFDYSFLYEVLSYQHSKMTFDYQTKAHPSVIQTIYSVPLLELKEQKKIGSLFKPIYEKLNIEKDVLKHYQLQKEYLLKNLFI